MPRTPGIEDIVTRYPRGHTPTRPGKPKRRKKVGSPRGAPICPKCGHKAETTLTKHGPRHECCGMWSWDWKPLQSAATMAARRSLVEWVKTLGEDENESAKLMVEAWQEVRGAGLPDSIGELSFEQVAKVRAAVLKVYAARLRRLTGL